MIIYLKPYEYYSDLYDQATIDRCSRMERRFLEGELPEMEGKKIPEKNAPNIRKSMAEYFLYFLTGERYKDKSEAIRKWMDRDQAKDDKLANTPEPKHIRCLGCSSYMKVESKHLETDIDDKNDRVLFFFECDRCDKRRLFWEDGEEWKYTPPPCPKCSTTFSHVNNREGDIVTTTYSCPKCGHKQVDTMDLADKPKVEEAIDPNFEANRQKYCLSDKEGNEYVSYTSNITEFVNHMKDKEENKEVFDAIAKIKKLTIIEVQNLLNPVIEAAGYTKLEFGKPELQRDLHVEFNVQDNTSGRTEYDSIHKLKKLINKTLEETNWRLMGDGVLYKLGFLTGRLRGIEGEENLRKLFEGLEKKAKSELVK